MPAKPNLEVLDAVKKFLPEDYPISYSNNTIAIKTPDEDTKAKWFAGLKELKQAVHQHDRFEDTIVVSMWPERQILVGRTAVKSSHPYPQRNCY